MLTSSSAGFESGAPAVPFGDADHAQNRLLVGVGAAEAIVRLAARPR